VAALETKLENAESRLVRYPHCQPRFAARGHGGATGLWGIALPPCFDNEPFISVLQRPYGNAFGSDHVNSIVGKSAKEFNVFTNDSIT